jgi:hypothetical protein
MNMQRVLHAFLFWTAIGCVVLTGACGKRLTRSEAAFAHCHARPGRFPPNLSGKWVLMAADGRQRLVATAVIHLRQNGTQVDLAGDYRWKKRVRESTVYDDGWQGTGRVTADGVEINTRLRKKKHRGTLRLKLSNGNARMSGTLIQHGREFWVALCRMY